MAVLDDVGVFGPVEDGHGALVALGSHVVVGGVDGHRRQVHKQVTHKHDARALGGLGEGAVVL